METDRINAVVFDDSIREMTQPTSCNVGYINGVVFDDSDIPQSSF